MASKLLSKRQKILLNFRLKSIIIFLVEKALIGFGIVFVDGFFGGFFRFVFGRFFLLFVNFRREIVVGIGDHVAEIVRFGIGLFRLFGFFAEIRIGIGVVVQGVGFCRRGSPFRSLALRRLRHLKTFVFIGLRNLKKYLLKK